MGLYQRLSCPDAKVEMVKNYFLHNAIVTVCDLPDEVEGNVVLSPESIIAIAARIEELAKDNAFLDRFIVRERCGDEVKVLGFEQEAASFHYNLAMQALRVMYLLGGCEYSYDF